MASDSSGNQWYQPVAGLSNVGSYQVSSIPWVTSSLVVNSSAGSVVEVSFPKVTKFIVVKNETANSIKVAFSQNGLTTSNNFFILGDSESFSADFRVTKVFLRGVSSASTVTIVAGLTGIEAGALSTNWSGSAGVG